jgi:hypothetical protein
MNDQDIKNWMRDFFKIPKGKDRFDFMASEESSPARWLEMHSPLREERIDHFKEVMTRYGLRQFEEPTKANKIKYELGRDRKITIAAIIIESYKRNWLKEKYVKDQKKWNVQYLEKFSEWINRYYRYDPNLDDEASQFPKIKYNTFRNKRNMPMKKEKRMELIDFLFKEMPED